MAKKILIVDDSPSVLAVIEDMLYDLGYEVDTAKDGSMACRLLETNRYDLIITDLSFDADHRNERLSSGEELSMALREEFPDLKIIMYSVEDRIQRVRHMIQNVGINAYVCKDSITNLWLQNDSSISNRPRIRRYRS